MSSSTVIHIGYPKAASSTLQKKVFREHSEINYLGPHALPPSNPCFPFKEPGQRHLLSSAGTFWNNLISLDGIAYDEVLNLELFNDSIQTYTSKEKINLFSHESLVGKPLLADNALKAERLKKIFKDPKILVVIRNQLDIMISLYYFLNGTSPLESSPYYKKSLPFDKWMEINLKHIDQSYLSAIDYYKLISYYEKIFGLNNLNILLYEELNLEPDKFAEKISQFLEINENETKEILHSTERLNSSKANQLSTIIGRITPNISSTKILPNNIMKFYKNKIMAIPTPKVKFSHIHCKKMRELYAESNQKLAVRFNLDLEKYSYPLK